MRVVILDSWATIGDSGVLYGVPTSFCRSVTSCCSVVSRSSLNDAALPDPALDIDFITVSTDTFTRFTSAFTVATVLCMSSSVVCVDVSCVVIFFLSSANSLRSDPDWASDPSAAEPGMLPRSLRMLSSSWRRSSISCMMFWFMMEE